MITKPGIEWIEGINGATAETPIGVAKVWRGERNPDGDYTPMGRTERVLAYDWHVEVEAGNLVTSEVTYSRDSARDLAFRVLRRVEAGALYRAIEAELGGEWTRRVENSDDSGHYQTVAFDGPAGAVLYLHVDENETKLRASGSYKEHSVACDQRRYDEKLPEVNVSADKGAAKIVADLRRRLFPALTDLVARCNAAIGGATRHNALTDKTAARVAKDLGGRVFEYRDHTKPSDHKKVNVDLAIAEETHVRLTVYGEEVTIETMTVNADQAVAMLRVLAGGGGARKGKAAL